jgi:membrane-associated phospholipid phosphatase
MINELNTQLFYILNSFSLFHPILDSALFSLANGTGVVLFPLVTLLLFLREKSWKRSALLLAHILIPVFIAIIYTEVLKNLFQAPRPWVNLSDVRVLFEYGGFDSFPSGHATAYGALALSTYFYNKHLGLYIGLVALCISLSRIIVGIHWPLDIIAGFAIGFSIAYLYYRYVQRRVSLL